MPQASKAAQKGLPGNPQAPPGLPKWGRKSMKIRSEAALGHPGADFDWVSYSKVMGFPGFLEFSGIFGVFEFFKGVLGVKIDSKLFLELLPSFLIPGLLGLVLPGSFRGLGCSKI